MKQRMERAAALAIARTAEYWAEMESLLPPSEQWKARRGVERAANWWNGWLARDPVM